MMAQLAWTLRQDPRIERVRIIDRRRSRCRCPAGSTAVPASTAARSTTPPASRRSSLLYGLRDGRGRLRHRRRRSTPVDGPLGAARPTASAVRRRRASTATRLAGGRRGRDGRCSSAPVSDTDAGRVRTVVAGGDRPAPAGVGLRRPAVAGRPHRATGRGSRTSRAPRSARSDVPGSDRRAGRGRSWSPATAPAGRGRATPAAATSLVVSRIAHATGGRVVRRDRRATDRLRRADDRASRSATSPGAPRRAWRCSARSPHDARRGRASSSVDGSPAAGPTPRPTIAGRLRSLAGSPAADEPLVRVSPGARSSTLSGSRPRGRAWLPAAHRPWSATSADPQRRPARC